MHGVAARGVGVCAVLCFLLCLLGAARCVRPVHQDSLVSAQRAQGAVPVCKGLHRAEVDWWVMLKHPGGYQYSYLDSTSVSRRNSGSCAEGLCWRHGPTMQNPNPVSHTLEVLTTAADSLAYVIYNDADPGGTEHFAFAHAKGVVAFTSTASHRSSIRSSSSGGVGFWLVHSAPRFPHAPGEPDWMQLQRPQSVFGQHFSCFSLVGNSSIAAVAKTLLAAGPYVFSSRLPASLAAEYPGWASVLAGAFDSRPIAVNNTLDTAAGLQLAVFAKSSSLNVSLTDAVVGPGLGANMLWATWRRSRDALPSFCRSAQPASQSSLNVAAVAFQGTEYAWAWDRDHSKWGVSSISSNRDACFVCLGDMNRAGWQAHRGGSYVCLQDRGLWESFHGILAAAEPCVWHA